jgi:hypothetical protein
MPDTDISVSTLAYLAIPLTTRGFSFDLAASMVFMGCLLQHGRMHCGIPVMVVICISKS